MLRESKFALIPAHEGRGFPTSQYKGYKILKDKLNPKLTAGELREGDKVKIKNMEGKTIRGTVLQINNTHGNWLNVRVQDTWGSFIDFLWHKDQDISLYVDELIRKEEVKVYPSTN